ncbi:DUF982 domain-containing protein [Mesorhizobium sp.]|uniref:DUF982 domain-containing protein n=1 Tax=Mesorhizobium sp. TaxID=1871066 RepID=UPI00257C6168|nr:DUF982 domain-containing protein [Mesorhizobium sp.]
MDTKRWKSYVRVELGGRDKRINIPSTRAAAECLLRSWPTEWGPRHKQAREACIAVLKGEQPPEFARQAFVEAAREAEYWLWAFFPADASKEAFARQAARR